MKKTYISPSMKVYQMNVQPMMAGSGDGTQVSENAYNGSLTIADSRNNSSMWNDETENDN